MKYYIIAKEFNYPDEEGYLPAEVVEEGEDPDVKQQAKDICEDEAMYVKERYGVEVNIIETLTGYAFTIEDIHFRCDIIVRNTNF